VLPGGWYVVVFDEYDHPLLGNEVLQEVSKGCELVAAGAEEHVMASFAEGWRDGGWLWSISHDAQEAFDHLATEGSVPEGFEAIRAQAFEEQQASGGAEADVDYFFDVPLDVAKLVTGFSHVETEPDDGFAVLAETTR
jgi:hypothetical protein